MGHRHGKAGRKWSITWDSGALKAAVGFPTMQPSLCFLEKETKVHRNTGTCQSPGWWKSAGTEMQVSSLPGLRQSWEGREQALMETRLCQTLYPGHYMSNAHRSPVRDTDFLHDDATQDQRDEVLTQCAEVGSWRSGMKSRLAPKSTPKPSMWTLGPAACPSMRKQLAAFGQLTNSFGQFQWPKGMSKPNQDKVTYNSYSLFTSPFPFWNIYNILLYINIKVYIIYFNLKGKNTINK